MKTKLILTDPDKYVVFAENDISGNLYAMTREELERKKKVAKEFGNRETNVPSQHTIKAYPMGLVDKTDSFYDKYDIISTDPVDLPINRIYWLFIQVVPEIK